MELLSVNSNFFRILMVHQYHLFGSRLSQLVHLQIFLRTMCALLLLLLQSQTRRSGQRARVPGTDVLQAFLPSLESMVARPGRYGYKSFELLVPLKDKTCRPFEIKYKISRIGFLVADYCSHGLQLVFLLQYNDVRRQCRLDYAIFGQSSQIKHMLC